MSQSKAPIKSPVGTVSCPQRIRLRKPRYLVGFVVAVWCLFGIFVFIWRKKIEAVGQFGDSFGMLNALVSALGAIAAYEAFPSQQSQLADQQREFEAQRHESHLFFLMQELTQAARSAAYSDTVYSWLGRLSSVTMQGHRAICHLENLFLGEIWTRENSLPLADTSVSADSKISYAQGYRFQVRRKEILSGIANSEPLQLKQRSLSPEEFVPALSARDLRYRMSIPQTSEAFHQFYEEAVGAPLGNVFRLQAAILRYIDTPSIPEPQRKQHADLFKAQMTDPELHLLLYYALSDLAGGDDLRQIMVRYNILEALWRKKPEFIWHRIPEISYFETEASPS